MYESGTLTGQYSKCLWLCCEFVFVYVCYSVSLFLCVCAYIYVKLARSLTRIAKCAYLKRV
jgi:hypothetical protein